MATATLATIHTPPSVARRPMPALARDLLAVAWEPGAAPPREVRVRPELAGRLGGEPGPDGQWLLGEPAGVPLVVDPLLPRSPGFEVRRVAPR
ncbi:hypothetical protein SAMN05660464_3433 [Geodermatophilus dictyosporus]|uniref:Uncharacterized protein n=1 Tax=Geodermatophilus dictyosporus TaxID=1523247 RepID=A0A1I5R344_9ACTN|nr:hypothetical protein [Geodermatophilus dictyosporus]SFP52476.1 hypothetical protein SAMN05660464_3433 [Geodermatophilus dictyosporus]